MKVLISAYACEPDVGSEPAIGWNVIKGLSNSHDLWVITRRNNAEVIEDSEEDWVTKINWIYVDLPRILSWWKKGRKGSTLYYALWQGWAAVKAWCLIDKEDFDLIHHLTFASIQPASPLGLLGLPFVAGPLGGAEAAPEIFVRSQSIKHRLQSTGGGMRRKIASLLSFSKVVYGRSAGSLGATRMSVLELGQLGGRHVGLAPQSGLDSALLEYLSRLRSEREMRRSGALKVIVASRLIWWKGVDLAIESVARVIHSGREITLTITEIGPELPRLKDLVKKLGVTKHVEFLGRLPSREDAWVEMSRQDVLMHPALQESFGGVCVEALALGMPVICMNQGGPGIIVNKCCGIKIEPGSRQKTIENYGKALCDIVDGKVKFDRSSMLSRAQEFTWEKLTEKIDTMYHLAASSEKAKLRKDFY